MGCFFGIPERETATGVASRSGVGPEFGCPPITLGSPTTSDTHSSSDAAADISRADHTTLSQDNRCICQRDNSH
jgi:hypothetical protein